MCQPRANRWWEERQAMQPRASIDNDIDDLAFRSSHLARPGSVMREPGPTGIEAGFTLLELLVVIAILGLLIGLVAPAALRQLGGAQTSIARQSIQRIGGVLDIYRLDMGAYPTTEHGLHALVARP